MTKKLKTTEKLNDWISEWIFGKLLRKYDFEIRCAFEHQIIYERFYKNNREFAYVPFRSGRLGLYEVIRKPYNVVFEDTGQYNWSFRFVNFVAKYDKKN